MTVAVSIFVSAYVYASPLRIWFGGGFGEVFFVDEDGDGIEQTNALVGVWE